VASMADAAARSPWRLARRRLGSIYKRSCLGEGFTTNTHVSQGSRHGQGGGAARVRRRCRWVAGAGRFSAAREHAARGKDGLGTNVGAEALGPAVAVVLRQSCPVGGGRPGVAMRTTSRMGASRHGCNFEWLCSNTILFNFSN
jgi:hypothetical protein